MPPDLCVQQLRAAGVNVVEMSVGGVSYKNHNRNSVGSWSDLHGITEHHTGSDTTNPLQYALNILWPGYSGLPGPLCQIATAPDGTIFMVGWGRCNHAGGGDPNVKNMLINDTIPWDREVKPQYGNTSAGRADGNAFMYGNEIMYSGGHPMTAAQLRSSAIFDVIICKYHGWRGNSVIGHREWSSDKPDPGYQDMAAKRRMVDSWIQNGIPGDSGGTIDMTDVNIVSMNEAVYERIAWWVLWNYKIPMMTPHGVNEPTTRRATDTTLGERQAWQEEWTFRAVNEAEARINQNLVTLGQKITETIVNDPNVDVDPAVIEKAVSDAIAGVTLTTTTTVVNPPSAPVDTTVETPPAPAT